jgi:hypothetical protein
LLSLLLLLLLLLLLVVVGCEQDSVGNPHAAYECDATSWMRLQMKATCLMARNAFRGVTPTPAMSRNRGVVC